MRVWGRKKKRYVALHLASCFLFSVCGEEAVSDRDIENCVEMTCGVFCWPNRHLGREFRRQIKNR